MCLGIEISIYKNTVFLMFVDGLRHKLPFAIVTLYETLISIPSNCHFIKLFNFIISPSVFSGKQLNFLKSEFRRISSILGIRTSDKFVILELLYTLRIVNLETFGTKLSSTYTTCIFIIIT